MKYNKSEKPIRYLKCFSRRMLLKAALIAVCSTAMAMTACAGGTGKKSIALSAAGTSKTGPGTAAPVADASANAGTQVNEEILAEIITITDAPGSTAQEPVSSETGPAAAESAGKIAGDSTAAAAESTAPAPETKAPEVSNAGIISPSGLDIEKINVPGDARILITVEADRTADHGILTVYSRQEVSGQGASGANAADPGSAVSPFEKVLECTAMTGKNGLYKEREGDNKTPVGIFKMNTPFGILPKAEGFPDNYLQVDDRYYWDGDSGSANYNRLVRTDLYSAFSRSESEHLVDYAGYYNYGIDMGYNASCTPKKGSALFLHCSVNGQNTHGCIGIPEAEMAAVLRLYQEGRTYIAVCDRADLAAAYR